MEHWFTYFSLFRGTGCRRIGELLVVAALVTGILSCQREETPAPAVTDSKWDRTLAQQQFLRIQAELQLASGENPYLVLDFSRNRLELKLRGAVVWDTPLEFATTDSTQIEDFIEKFDNIPDWPVRTMERVHLFEATRKMSDSIIAIVAEAVNVSPDNLQRMLPERFRINWNDGLALEVVSDIEGAPVSILGNSLEEMRKVINKPLGGTMIVIKLDARQATTFYGFSKPGLKTLIKR